MYTKTRVLCGFRLKKGWLGCFYEKKGVPAHPTVILKGHRSLFGGLVGGRYNYLIGMGLVLLEVPKQTENNVKMTIEQRSEPVDNSDKEMDGGCLPIAHPLRFPCMHYHQCKNRVNVRGFYDKPWRNVKS